MADYQLTENEHTILRTADNVWIPDDPANVDYQEYLKWVEAGNEADPYVAPPPPEQVPTAEQQLLFDHENRLLVIEGQPPLSQEEFVAKATGTKTTTARKKKG